MNKIYFAALCLASGLLSASAQAAGGFYVDNGYTGTAVFRASGGCKSQVVYKDAMFGTVYNELDNKLGLGLVSPDGDLLAMMADGLKVSGFQDSSGMKYSSTYYVNFSSISMRSTFEKNGACTVFAAYPDPGSRLVYATNINKGSDKATLKFTFSGYEAPVVTDKDGDSITRTPAFNGSITFKGSHPVP